MNTCSIADRIPDMAKMKNPVSAKTITAESIMEDFMGCQSYIWQL
jgi:hypothetical protein